MDKTAELKKIRDEIWNLKESPLYEYRTSNKYYPVIGEGNHDANIMFIGEAPGRNEAETGRPFCGAAGKLLDQLIVSIGLERKDVYITNIVKDRPPENRDPTPDEIKLYSPFLSRQVDIIQPKVIATLGRFSMWFILELFDLPEKTQTISKLHGTTLNATTSYGTIKVVPLYHPAVALYNGSNKKILQEDFKVLKPFI
jgi:DNA polymerase